MQTTQNIIRPKTGAYSVLASECAWWYVFTNEWAGALVAFTLPSAVANYKVSFVIQNAFGLSITPAWGDTINGGWVVSYTTVWDVIELICINNNEWIATITSETTPVTSTSIWAIPYASWQNYWYTDDIVNWYVWLCSWSSFSLYYVKVLSSVVKNWVTQSLNTSIFWVWLEARWCAIINWFVYLNAGDTWTANIYKCDINDDVTNISNRTLITTFALSNNFLIGYDGTWLCFQYTSAVLDRYTLTWTYIDTLTFVWYNQVVYVWNDKYWVIDWATIIWFVDSTNTVIPWFLSFQWWGATNNIFGTGFVVPFANHAYPLIDLS